MNRNGSQQELCHLFAVIEAELQAKDEYINQLEKRLKNYQKNCPEASQTLEADDKYWNPYCLKNAASYKKANNAVEKANNHRKDVVETQGVMRGMYSNILETVLTKGVNDTLENDEFRKLEMKLVGVEKELEETKKSMLQLEEHLKKESEEANAARRGFQLTYADCVSLSKKVDAYEQYIEKQEEALHTLPQHTVITTKNKFHDYHVPTPSKPLSKKYSPQIKPLQASSLSPDSDHSKNPSSSSTKLTQNINSQLASEIAEDLKIVEPASKYDTLTIKPTSQKLKPIDFKSFTKSKIGERVKKVFSRSRPLTTTTDENRGISPTKPELIENVKSIEVPNSTQLTTQIQSTLESLTSIELLLRSTTDAETHNV